MQSNNKMIYHVVYCKVIKPSILDDPLESWVEEVRELTKYFELLGV